MREEASSKQLPPPVPSIYRTQASNPSPGMASAASVFSPIVSFSPALSSKISMKLFGRPDPSSSDVRDIKLPKLSAVTGTGLQIKGYPQVSSKIDGTNYKVGISSGSGKDEDQSMLINPIRYGWIEQDGKLHRQHFVIRSYEIGADGTASAETLMNYFQETISNHLKYCTGVLICDGLGSTPEMSKRDLIWVVSKMQILVDCYPSRTDVVEMTTWLSAYSGRNGVRFDCLCSDANTGQTCARATSALVMINKKTRKFSKIPEEVRGEIEPYLAHPHATADECRMRKIPKLDAISGDYLQKGLVPRWSDLDINQHVNNVKYIALILESTPRSILENHVLAGITLEYKRESNTGSRLQSLTSVSTQCGNRALESGGELECQHLICLEDGAEVVRGRTLWKPKHSYLFGREE